jgi:hypothetical protein
MFFLKKEAVFKSTATFTQPSLCGDIPLYTLICDMYLPVYPPATRLFYRFTFSRHTTSVLGSKVE